MLRLGRCAPLVAFACLAAIANAQSPVTASGTGPMVRNLAPGAPRVLSSRLESPTVQPSPNTERAGTLHDGVLTVALEAKQVLWHLDGPARPATTIEAFAEDGKAPLTPWPLVRVSAGPTIHLSIRNSLPTPLTFSVPAALCGGAGGLAFDNIVTAPGAVGVLTTRATVPGDYPYAATVGDSLHWRVINASRDVDPMHLQGFYYRVDTFSAMSMSRSPDRPGNWIVRCHFARVPIRVQDAAASGPALTAPPQYAGLTVARAPATLAFTHVGIVDVERGGVLPNRTVLIIGNRIRVVAPTANVRVPAGARVVDGSGKYLIPGLWDMHAHTVRAGRPAWMFPLFVAAGITGVRDTGAPLDTLLLVRASVRSGAVLGPRIVGTGPLLDGPLVKPGGQYPALTAFVATPEDGRRIVDSLANAGVDEIKVYNGLSREAFFAIADEAKRRGIPMIGHVPGSVTAREASDAGLRSMEHMTRVMDVCIPDSVVRALDAEQARRFHRGMRSDSVRALYSDLNHREAAAFDRGRCEAAGARFARNGTWQDPTLARDWHWTREYLASSAAGHDADMTAVPAAVQRFWGSYRDSIVADPFAGEDTVYYRNKARDLLALYRGGDGILAGTDTDGDDSNVYGVPGSTVHLELEAFVRDVGLTPLEALRTATLNPAKFLGATDSLGTVAAGKLADLVLLDANPLADIANARKIDAVVLNGRYLDRTALAALLAPRR